jgi:hypothetical protein
MLNSASDSTLTFFHFIHGQPKAIKQSAGQFIFYKFEALKNSLFFAFQQLAHIMLTD